MHISSLEACEAWILGCAGQSFDQPSNLNMMIIKQSGVHYKIAPLPHTMQNLVSLLF